jgi:hypothetical protein
MEVVQSVDKLHQTSKQLQQAPAHCGDVHSVWLHPKHSVSVLQTARDMPLDDELGMSSDALPDASATADSDAELKPSADSSSNAREFAHGANADP